MRCFTLTEQLHKSGSDFYFVDKTGNNRNFLITGYDFDSTWTKGFPYKSAATISAPAGDTTLIAADINNYLYAVGGTPNQIPVVSLFQDIDYEHKLFCRHVPQVVDGNEVEVIEAKVVDIVLYSTVKSDTYLPLYKTYYSIPVEDITTSVWLSPLGNDTTGDGSKANPYRSIAKVKATTKATIYLLTGNYDFGAVDVNLTGNSVQIVSTGFVSFSLRNTGTYGLRINRNTTFKKLYNFSFHINSCCRLI